MTPEVHDLLLHAGFEKIQRHVLNYYREDLDYPAHSARAIVSLCSSMLSLVEDWALLAPIGSGQIIGSLRDLLELWSAEARR